MTTALALADERTPRLERAPAPPARAALRLEVGTPASIDAALLDAWSELAGSAGEPNAFAEPWFVTAGLRHLAGEAEVRLAQLWDRERLVALFPLVVERSYGRAPIAHVANWRHANDFLGVPLIRAGYEAQAWNALLGALDKASWARGFLHLNGLVEGGAAYDGLFQARRCEIVHREVRALLASPLSAEAYYADTVRKKKRKELGRLQRRLGELGAVTSATLRLSGDLSAWCDAFLDLERSGWKGRAGSALASAPATEAFFREAMAGAFAAGRLEFRRMDLDGKPIAMLINFISAPGGFSFKTAFDEAYSRFSPGVLIQLDNLASMERDGVQWMDSCAAPDHPMIDSLWGERRTLLRVTVPLAGVQRGLAFKLARTLEDGSARLRAALSRRAASEEQTNG